MSFKLDIGESVIIAGNPKSGKTKFAKWVHHEYLPYFGNSLILQVDRDIPPDKPWENYCESVIPWRQASASNIINELRASSSVCIDAHDNPIGKSLQKIWSTVCAVSLARGNTLVVCDEIARVTNVRFIDNYHFLLVTGNGRKRRNSIIQATQTPQTCSVQIRDQAAHQIYFRLDERVVYNYLNGFLDNAERVLSLPKYHSLYKTNAEGGQSRTEILKPCPLV